MANGWLFSQAHIFGITLFMNEALREKNIGILVVL